MDLGPSVRRALEIAGVPQDRKTVGLLAAHLEMVLEANKTFNLTAIRDPESAVLLHVVDSLLGLPEIEVSPPGPLVDLGSGAGFPGIPLGIVTGRRVFLVESVGKKAWFLEDASTRLRLDAEVVNMRAEAYASQHPGVFCVVVARALASLPVLVELAAPLLAEGGHFVAYKGEPDSDEIARGDRVAELVGLTRVSRREVVLEEAQRARRTLLVYRRVRKSGVRLPRRTGLAQNQPIA
jgi:16S rRNA (guanine527-N7)-methyltransferase